MTDIKKITAAVGAVMDYIRTEEEILRMQAAMFGAPQERSIGAPTPAAVFKPWAMNARQTQMQMRNLMQMRTFQRIKWDRG